MGGAALALLLLVAVAEEPCAAQYEEYSVRGFPAAALEPLQRAYARALAQYAGAHWAESARELEASLRLHRLLRDSEAHCHRRCAAEGDPAEDPLAEGDPAEWEWERELQLFGRLLRRAGCLRACKRGLPVFQLRYPPAQTLRDFQRRLPYQYLHYALFKVRRRGVPGGGANAAQRGAQGARRVPGSPCSCGLGVGVLQCSGLAFTSSPHPVLHGPLLCLSFCSSVPQPSPAPPQFAPLILHLPMDTPILHRPVPHLHSAPPKSCSRPSCILLRSPSCSPHPVPPMLGIPPPQAPPSCPCTVARQRHLGRIRQDVRGCACNWGPSWLPPSTALHGPGPLLSQPLLGVFWGLPVSPILLWIRASPSTALCGCPWPTWRGFPGDFSRSAVPTFCLQRGR